MKHLLQILCKSYRQNDYHNSIRKKANLLIKSSGAASPIRPLTGGHSQNKIAIRWKQCGIFSLVPQILRNYQYELSPIHKNVRCPALCVVSQKHTQKPARRFRSQGHRPHKRRRELRIFGFLVLKRIPIVSKQEPVLCIFGNV